VPGIRILVAGEAAGYSEESLRSMLADAPEVRLDARFIPDDELQWWFRAADALVLPYRAGLNSGAMLLGASFGLPVMMTESDAAADVASEPWAHVIARSEPLATGIARGLATFALGPEVRQAALAYAEARSPQIAAAEFAREVERVLALPGRSSS
jgi:glycosyltransferase involved in cell wall biosynthesis